MDIEDKLDLSINNAKIKIKKSGKKITVVIKQQ